MEIAFVVVEALGKSVELYVSANEEYLLHNFSAPHANTFRDRKVGPSHKPYDEGELQLSETMIMIVQTQFPIEVPSI